MQREVAFFYTDAMLWSSVLPLIKSLNMAGTETSDQDFSWKDFHETCNDVVNLAACFFLFPKLW